MGVLPTTIRLGAHLYSRCSRATEDAAFSSPPMPRRNETRQTQAVGAPPLPPPGTNPWTRHPCVNAERLGVSQHPAGRGTTCASPWPPCGSTAPTRRPIGTTWVGPEAIGPRLHDRGRYAHRAIEPPAAHEDSVRGRRGRPAVAERVGRHTAPGCSMTRECPWTKPRSCSVTGRRGCSRRTTSTRCERPSTPTSAR